MRSARGRYGKIQMNITLTVDSAPDGLLV